LYEKISTRSPDNIIDVGSEDFADGWQACLEKVQTILRTELSGAIFWTPEDREKTAREIECFVSKIPSLPGTEERIDKRAGVIIRRELIPPRRQVCSRFGRECHFILSPDAIVCRNCEKAANSNKIVEPPRPKVLFVCNSGYARSKTAAETYSDQFETRYLGIFDYGDFKGNIGSTSRGRV
jgi:hypothetical protein